MKPDEPRVSGGLEQITKVARNTGEIYRMPQTPYPAPPVQFRNNRGLRIFYETTPEVLRKLVPEPLVPNPENLMQAYIGQFNLENSLIGTYSYKEAGFLVPVTFSNTRGNYAVYLYLDKAFAIVWGREIWGWPKKDANLSFKEQGGRVFGRVERFGTTLIKASMTISEQVEPVSEDPSSQDPIFTLKLIPSVKKDAPPDLMQLTTTSLRDQKAKEQYTGKATLELHSSDMDPLGEIKIKEIVGARFTVSESVLGFGDVLLDYLGKSTTAETVKVATKVALRGV